MYVNGILSAVRNGVDNSYVTDENVTPSISSFSLAGNESTLTLDLSSNASVVASEL